MANYTHRRCSQETEVILKKHRYWHIPVDIETLAQEMGYRVHALERIHERTGLRGTGFLKLPEDRLEIVVDCYHYENYPYPAKFTIAEELSHLLIHEEHFRHIRTPEDRIDFERNLTEEQDKEFQGQAKRYGSYFLVPNDLFLPLCEDWIANNYNDIVKDNPQNDNELISFLAERLQHKVEASNIVLTKVFNRYLPTGVKLIDHLIQTSTRKLITPR